MKDKDWFVNWFDTEWYHRLYAHRDHREARLFMDAIIDYLNPSAESRFLDLACGKGRHAAYLAEKGFDVVGVDLSPDSIAAAQSLAHARLRFAVHDMRTLFAADPFDYVLNLFTSFGYFETDKEHLDVLVNMRDSLRKNGRVVLDFLNAHKVEENLVKEELITRDSLKFQIHRRIQSGFVHKEIIVTDKNQEYHFSERVRLYHIEDFRRLFAQAHLEITQIFGDYQLGAFQDDSPRLILIASPK